MSYTQEFNKHDLVTFQSYGKTIKAKVIEVQKGYFMDNDNYYYRLEGASSPLETITTGRGILESKLYVGNNNTNYFA